eukprot:scaffold1007_cov364-Prasinococcus_capsulatus_cf.AAC.3
MNEFKIQYSSILRIFVLPKDNSPLVYVNIALDPPIRKGQTFYPHLLLQFEVDDEDEYTLDIDEVRARGYGGCGGRSGAELERAPLTPCCRPSVARSCCRPSTRRSSKPPTAGKPSRSLRGAYGVSLDRS